ncbi:MAG: hypothetical protein ACREDO_06270, partial [Methyloceanibacter sp.]
VLASVQGFAARHGFYVSRMQRKLHEYHLDDAPDLKSCNLYLTALPGNRAVAPSAAITDTLRLEHFYGLSQRPTVRYVRVRIPTKPASDSDQPPATHSDFIPAGIPI